MSSEESIPETTIFTEPVEKIQCSQCGHIVDMRGSAPFTKRFCPSCGAKKTVPARLGTYLLLECIGAGGMGAVFRGLDPSLDRTVAVKVMNRLLGQDPTALAAFRKEARAAARFNHPHAAQVFTFGESHGQPYIVMEFVQGRPLNKLVHETGMLDQSLAVSVGLQTAEALSVAASTGLLHGDVKPENIMVDENGRSKLIDFGLAAFADQQPQGQTWGSPYYLAPERILRQPTDFRTDIYSLGATLYEALAGRPPFSGGSVREVLNAHLAGNAPTISSIRRDVDPEVEKIVMRALRRQPAERYPNYDSLTGDLRRTLSRLGGYHPRNRRGMIHGAHTGFRLRSESPSEPPASRGGREESSPLGLRPIQEPTQAGLRPIQDEPAPQKPRAAPDPGHTMMLSLPEEGFPKHAKPDSQAKSRAPGVPPVGQVVNPAAPAAADGISLRSVPQEHARQSLRQIPPTRQHLRSVAPVARDTQPRQQTATIHAAQRTQRRLVVRQNSPSEETSPGQPVQAKPRQEPNVLPFVVMLGVIAAIVLMMVGFFIASQSGQTPTSTPSPIASGGAAAQQNPQNAGAQKPAPAGSEQATDDRATTTFGRAVNIQVLDNDGTGPDARPPLIVAITTPQNGFAAVQRSAIGYRPKEGFTGSDQFQYTVKYPSGRTSSATVTIEVTAH